jgi:hypothetical protein
MCRYRASWQARPNLVVYGAYAVCCMWCVRAALALRGTVPWGPVGSCRHWSAPVTRRETCAGPPWPIGTCPCRVRRECGEILEYIMNDHSRDPRPLFLIGRPSATLPAPWRSVSAVNDFARRASRGCRRLAPGRAEHRQTTDRGLRGHPASVDIVRIADSCLPFRLCMHETTLPTS